VAVTEDDTLADPGRETFRADDECHRGLAWPRGAFLAFLDALVGDGWWVHWGGGERADEEVPGVEVVRALEHEAEDLPAHHSESTTDAYLDALCSADVPFSSSASFYGPKVVLDSPALKDRDRDQDQDQDQDQDPYWDVLDLPGAGADEEHSLVDVPEWVRNCWAGSCNWVKVAVKCRPNSFHPSPERVTSVCSLCALWAGWMIARNWNGRRWMF